MSKGKFALGALIGAVAGVIAGILTAPKSGKDTRSDIKEKAAELKDAAAKRTEKAKDTAVHLAHDVRDKAMAHENRAESEAVGVKKGFFTKRENK